MYIFPPNFLLILQYISSLSIEDEVLSPSPSIDLPPSTIYLVCVYDDVGKKWKEPSGYGLMISTEKSMLHRVQLAGIMASLIGPCQSLEEPANSEVFARFSHKFFIGYRIEFYLGFFIRR